jgi:peptide deformylase
MALLDILEFPDPRLRTVARPVTEVNNRIVTLCDDMLETMYAAPGIGLAASQINPEIVESDGEIETDEGCLSIPGFYEPVIRFEKIQVKALNRQGEVFVIDADDLLAVCIQHEMDHLEGKLFVDYISTTKRQMIRKKLLKQQKYRD